MYVCCDKPPKSLKEYVDNVLSRPLPPGVTVSNVNSDITPEPLGFMLYENYPNPFNPETTIKFDIVNDESVELVVFDLNGRKVKTLINTTLSAVTHEAKWQGRNDSGRDVVSGVYLYQLRVDDRITLKKMTLVR